MADASRDRRQFAKVKALSACHVEPRPHREEHRQECLQLFFALLHTAGNHFLTGMLHLAHSMLFLLGLEASGNDSVGTLPMNCTYTSCEAAQNEITSKEKEGLFPYSPELLADVVVPVCPCSFVRSLCLQVCDCGIGVVCLPRENMVPFDGKSKGQPTSWNLVGTCLSNPVVF